MERVTFEARPSHRSVTELYLITARVKWWIAVVGVGFFRSLKHLHNKLLWNNVSFISYRRGWLCDIVKCSLMCILIVKYRLIVYFTVIK